MVTYTCNVCFESDPCKLTHKGEEEVAPNTCPYQQDEIVEPKWTKTK